MPWLAQQDLFEWSLVQGAEMGLPHQLMSGNIPFLSPDRAQLGLLQGFGLLLLAWLASLKVRQLFRSRRLSPSRARLLGLLVFFGFFVAWEFALQSALNRVQETYIPDPIAFWKANPELALVANASKKGAVGLNRSAQPGLFDQDHTGPKPANTFRIAFMGDSQVISSGPHVYAGQDTYPKILESSLAESGLEGPQGQQVQVINAGMSGHTSWQGLMLLRSEVLPLEPDVLVEAFGYHDSNGALSHDHEVLTDSYALWRARTILYRSRVFLLLRTLMLRRQADLNDVTAERDLVQRVPPPHFEKNLRTLLDMGDRHSFRVVFLLEPLRDRHDWERTAKHLETARRLALEKKVLLIDGFDRFAGMDDEERAGYFDDSIHLNRAGHRVLAELVLKELLGAGVLAPGTPKSSQAPSGKP